MLTESISTQSYKNCFCIERWEDEGGAADSRISSWKVANARERANEPVPMKEIGDADTVSDDFVAEAREWRRLKLLLERDGPAMTRDWVQRTLRLYRKAVDNSHHYASTGEYRREFEASIRVFKAWLDARPAE